MRSEDIHIIKEMSLAKQAFGSNSLAPKGLTLISYIDEVQKKCEINLESLSCVVHNFPFFMSGERHAMMRQKVLRYMGSEAKLKPWEAYIDDSLGRALDKLEAKKEVDLLADFINPFLEETTCTILGIMTEDPGKVRKCVALAERLLDPLLPIRTLKELESAFADFFEEILSKESTTTESENTSLLSALLEEPVPGYSRKDISAFALAVHVGTAALRYTLANAIFRLLVAGDAVKNLATSEDWVRSNLEHLIRESVAVRGISRRSKEHCEIEGELFEAGEEVLIDMQAVHHGADTGCPMHKEKKWDDETLSNKTHVAFGKGTHYCLGANYSKFVLKKVLPALFSQYPDLRLVSQSPDLTDQTQIFGVKTLKCFMHSN